MSIPDGYTYVEGRDGYRARALLAAAEKVGLKPEVVVAQRGGYLVPDAVAVEYEKSTAPYPVPEGPPEGTPTEPEPDQPDDSWKNADIEDYAETHGIDLGGATKKADMLAAIAAANKEE